MCLTPRRNDTLDLLAPNATKIASTPAIRVRRIGGDTVTALVDDPYLRSGWCGTRRLLHNAFFFSGAVRSIGSIGQRTEDEEMGYGHGHNR